MSSRFIGKPLKCTPVGGSAMIEICSLTKECKSSSLDALRLWTHTLMCLSFCRLVAHRLMLFL